MKPNLVSLALLVLALATGCSEDSAAQQPTIPNGRPADYFPSDVGHQFRYTVTLGEVEPLRYEEVAWPNGTGSLTYATRGLMRGLPGRKSTDGALRLRLTVKARARKQGPFSYPDGVVLSVDRDDLGFFGGAKEVYWAITSGAGRVLLVVPHDPEDSPVRGSWGSWGVDPGYSTRVLYFAEKPLTSIGLGREPEETLLFKGIDPQSPVSGEALLHFVREVKANARVGSERSHIDNGFEETMWFARAKGLVRLHQRVGGKTSMIWNLEP